MTASPASSDDTLSRRAGVADVELRERRTEGAVAAVVFGQCAAALLLVAQALSPSGSALVAWLTGLAFVLLQIEFEVGQGRTRPVQLALVPMLVILPPALVPALLALANVLARVKATAVHYRHATPVQPRRSPMCRSRLGPAVVLCAAGSPLRFWGWAAVRRGGPSLAQIGVDFAVAAIRLPRRSRHLP